MSRGPPPAPGPPEGWEQGLWLCQGRATRLFSLVHSQPRPHQGTFPHSCMGPCPAREGFLCTLVQGQLPGGQQFHTEGIQQRGWALEVYSHTSDSSDLQPATPHPSHALNQFCHQHPLSHSTQAPRAVNAELGRQTAQGFWLALPVLRGLVSMPPGPVIWHWHCSLLPSPAPAEPQLTSPTL